MAMGHPYTLLSTQYRMYPSISSFPSKQFYQSLLRDGDNVHQPGYLPTFIRADSQSFLSLPALDGNNQAHLRPFLFFNLHSSLDSLGTSSTGSQSMANREEAVVCSKILAFLGTESRRMGETLGSVGIITPYNEQRFEVTQILTQQNMIQQPLQIDREQNNNSGPSERKSGKSVLKGFTSKFDLEVNTVDGFQGKEKDFNRHFLLGY